MDSEAILERVGAYGIGIGRAMATIVETHHDDKGIVWPKSVAPFQAHLLNLSENSEKAEKVYKRLLDAGIEVLYDDRDISAGEKFADCDLLGIPVRLVVSDKTGDKVEWKERGKKEVEMLGIEEIMERLKGFRVYNSEY